MRKHNEYKLTIQQATKKALEIVDKIYIGCLPWPEDEWYIIADNWTLNLYYEVLDQAVIKKADLYPNPSELVNIYPVKLPSYIMKENL